MKFLKQLSKMFGSKVETMTEPEAPESLLQRKRQELVRRIFSYSQSLPMTKGYDQVVNPHSGIFISEDVYELKVKLHKTDEDISLDVSKFDEQTKQLDHIIVVFNFIPNRSQLISMIWDGEETDVHERLRSFENIN